MKIKLLFLSLLLIGGLRVKAQTLTPEQLQADFTRFRTALAEVHPEMYRYTPKPVFDSLFAATQARLNRPMTQQEFYVTMVPLLVALKDGHIKWIPAGQDEHYPFSTSKLFPLKVYVVENRVWVVGNCGSETVPKGAELLRINGKPVSEVIQQLLPNMTFADGHTVNGKYEDLNHFFAGYYATFIGAPDAYEVQYRSGNEEKMIALAPVTLDQIKAYDEKQKPAAQKPFRLTFTDDFKAATMTIERFWDDKKEQDYAKFLKQSFRELREKRVESLVLDLRNNEGGEEKYGVLLYQYLARKPFRYYEYISVRQKKNYSFPVWSPKLYQKFKWLVVRKRGDGYVFTKQAGLKRQKPKRDAFQGNLAVLVNGLSFSVTTEFSARVHADQRATFIGQETGGGYVGDNSGIFAITQLPHSKIDLGIGMFGFHMANLPATLKPGQGILPDHVVVPTVEDVLTGNDRAMQKALQLIQTGSAAGKSSITTR
ncbi:peptidase S41-like protein [Larkinella arboricola]|uniref:Peptidase S41-like protein n=1 Tax=Larkinella arboricola TaxID=643671 RepID=A0A327WQ12_LARAB|nr:S41 family peptidase [Larkinella arboricola]RAJ94000.1 peptidase S41-like protein [Larkinella arboricola]